MIAKNFFKLKSENIGCYKNHKIWLFTQEHTEIY
jgi:hypothetical protein